MKDAELEALIAMGEAHKKQHRDYMCELEQYWAKRDAGSV